MANEPYKDQTWLYEHYVKKRMNLTDICKILKQSYGITITPQALYNWVNFKAKLWYNYNSPGLI